MCPCRLTALTSLCVQFHSSIRGWPQLWSLSHISQLRELRELRVEEYLVTYGDLAYLPLSLTSLDLGIKRWEGEVINAKAINVECASRSLGRLARLRQFRIRGDASWPYHNEWKELLAPLARISGLSDLEASVYVNGDIFSSLSGFSNLTQLSVYCDCFRQGCNKLWAISDLSGLKALRLVGGTKHQPARYPASLACLSSLSLLTSLTVMGLRAEDISWLTCPTLLAGLQGLGVQHCSFPMLQCMPQLSAATALRSLHLSGQEQMIGPHLTVITSSQQLTYLDVSRISGLESQHLCFFSELQSLAEFCMADNPTLDESVLPLLQPLSSFQSLDVSKSDWLSKGGLHHIAGIQGLSHLKVEGCRGITVAGIMEMVSCGCGALISVMLGQDSTPPGYHAYVRRSLRGAVGPRSVSLKWAI